jgi:hypothetical protein
MQPFQLSPDMLNLRGQFYPTGHIVAMFPAEDAARAAGEALARAGLPGDAVALISPEVMLRDIVRTVGNGDIPLPSAGTEGDTVRRFADYASDGHWALLIRAGGDDGDRALEVLQGHHKPSHAQKYRMLVIEDIA